MLQSALEQDGNQSAGISSEVILLAANAKEGRENTFEELFSLYEKKSSAWSTTAHDLVWTLKTLLKKYF